ncbi:hypothetical protein D3C80_1032810 [compost metagenome]
MGAIIVGEILAAQGRNRHQAVGARLVQPHEQAEAGDAGDAPAEGRADMVFQEGGDVAVHGVALGGHGAALGARHLLGDGRQFGDLAVRQAVRTQVQAADQAAVNDQVGIAPDRRGEVGVAVQVQTEVTDVVRRIDGLHLGAQDHLVDHLGVRRVAHLV